MHEAYAARGFRVVRVPPLDVPLGAALDGRPVSAEKKSGAFAGRGGAWVSLRELGASGRSRHHWRRRTHRRCGGTMRRRGS